MPVLKVFKDGAWQNITSDGVSSWNDLTDKPFGGGIEKDKEIFSISGEFTESVFQIVQTDNFEIENGKTYLVDYDETTYECVAYNITVDVDGSTVETSVIGNAKAVAADGGNNEPFFIGSETANELAIFASTPGVHNVALYTSINNIKKLDKKYLPEISWNDLTDKPFGDDCTIKEKGEEIFSISYDFVAGDHGEIFYSENSVLEITEGEIYFVDYDGTTYECIAYLANAGSDDEPNYLPVVGNVEIVGMSGGNAEPFFIGISDINTFVYVQTEGTHDVVLYACVDGVGLKKLDKKYLPDDIGGVTSWNNLEDKPFEVPTIYYEWNYQERYPETAEPPNGKAIYVKINDEIPESSDFFLGKYISMTAAINSTNGSMFLSDESVIKESDIRVIFSSDGTEQGYTVCFMIAVIFSDVTETDPESGATLTLSRGVWFLNPIAGFGGKAINCRVIDAPSKKINDIVIPDTIARVAQLEKLITYGEDDLISGESKLDTGTLYFVYE